MIDLYSGTPGSGKSLHVAEKMEVYLHLHKCPVIANFEFKAYVCRPRGWGSFFYKCNADLTPDFLVNFSEFYRKKRKMDRLPEESILLVIDECQLIFNARSWNDRDRLEWISFFSQHRKLGYNVILVAQYIDMIDKQIRPLIEYEHLHRKVKNIGGFGFFLNLVSGGNLHICNTVYLPSNMPVGHYFFRGDKHLYRLYDSYTRF